MATFPTTGNAEVVIRRIRRQGQTVSPFTGGRKVYDWNADKWEATVTTPPMKEGDSNINTWIQFFEDCDGMVNTFTMNISRYVPGQAGLTSVTFRMVDPDKDWKMDKRKVFPAFTFTALSE